MKPRKLNVRLLRKVQKHILEEPRRLDMHDWKRASDQVPCGTVACIAGWAAILSGKLRVNKFGATAAELLGIEYKGSWNKEWKLEDVDRRSESGRLFLAAAWPSEFWVRYVNAETPKQRARATAARIEHFIKTKGAE